ncbi:MAG: PHP domain-containing protein [Acidobacteria bacterium]|nr:PHP domain-containing protein [Acidobacteriota bacterium]
MKTPPFYDLHVHSNYSSDGEWTVDQLFSRSEELGMVALAVSDHDTVAALAHRRWIEREFPSVEWVPNVEISSGLRGRELHLLSPFVNPEAPALLELLQRIHVRRDEQARGRMERLCAMGIQITEEEVRCQAGDLPLTGPAIARAVLDKYRSEPPPALVPYLLGDKRTLAEANFYRDFFFRGKPAHVPKMELEIHEAISTVRAAGGVPVLAHPGARFTQADAALIAELKGLGLEGLEVWTSYHDGAEVEHFSAIAERLGLIATAGSDFHGRAKPQVVFGSISRGTPEMLANLRSRAEAVGSR